MDSVHSIGRGGDCAGLGVVPGEGAQTRTVPHGGSERRGCVGDRLGAGNAGSPILAATSSKPIGPAILALVAFLAVAINLVLAKLMQTPASS
jgi:hypothetical protein